MSSPLFSGLCTAMITPFDPAGIQYDTFAAQLQYQICSGAAAVVVCGTTGEAATLSCDERRRLIRLASDHCGTKLKVIAGIGSNNTSAAADAAQQAADDGADGVLLTTPYYNKANEAGMIRHFTHVADRSPVPLIVYNVPGRTGCGCTPEIYAALAPHPMIHGIKEASGDLTLVSRTMQRCGDNLHIWCGNDEQTLPMMALGAKGVISVAGNIIPKAMSGLCRACLQDDLESARLLHRHFLPLFDALFAEVNPIPVKKAMEIMGMDSGLLRLPLCEMSRANSSLLQNCLHELGLAA